MLEIIDRSVSVDGSVKFALQNHQGNKFESIYFRLPPRNGIPYEIYHICISSQAGCAMGCKFCATAYGGFFSDLTADEMLAEITTVRDYILGSNLENHKTGFNIVLMGMGEPLMNYENVVEFCYKARNQFFCLNKIALSTIGISNRIYDLSDLPIDLNIKLFLSIHSPYNEERVKIMPITKKYPIESIIDASKEYAKKTKSLVKATYLLLAGINDSIQHAEDFAALLDPQHFEAQIQLYNLTPGIPYLRAEDSMAYRFRDIIAGKGIDTIVQISKGRDVDGGCGQLIKNINEKTAKRILKQC